MDFLQLLKIYRRLMMHLSITLNTNFIIYFRLYLKRLLKVGSLAFFI